LNVNSRLTGERATFIANQARGGAGGSSRAAGGNGGAAKGGVSHTGAASDLPGVRPISTFLDVTVRGNQVTGGPGGDGGAGQGGNGGQANGGGLSVNQGGHRPRQYPGWQPRHRRSGWCGRDPREWRGVLRGQGDANLPRLQHHRQPGDGRSG